MCRAMGKLLLGRWVKMKGLVERTIKDALKQKLEEGINWIQRMLSTKSPWLGY